MNLKEKIIFLSSIGFGLGVISGVLITAGIATLSHADGTLYVCADELTEAVGDPLAAFFIQAVVSGLYGMIVMGGTVVYSMDEWGILKSTLVHYVLMITSYIITSLLLRWYAGIGIIRLIYMLIAMTAVYFLIWLISYLVCRSQLADINKGLEELKDREAAR